MLYHNKELGSLAISSASAYAKFLTRVGCGTRAFAQESWQWIVEFLMRAGPPSFPPQHAPCTRLQHNQFSPRLQHPSSSVRSTEQAGEGHSGVRAALEMEDSMYARTSKSGFFIFFSPFLLFSAQFIIRELCQSPACGLCSHTRVQPQLCAAVHAHAVSELRKLLLPGLINWVQVSRLGCELSPPQCQMCFAGISHLGSCSIQLLPKLKAGKCSAGCGECPLL